MDASQSGGSTLQAGSPLRTRGIETPPDQLGWLKQSFLAFCSGELEEEYQTYQSSSYSMWTWGSAVSLFMGWPAIFFKLHGKGRDYGHLLPPLLLPFLLHFIPSLALNLLLILRPKLYAKHKRLVNALVQLVFAGNCIFMREAVLWMKLVDNAGSSLSAHSSSWIDSLLSLPHENIFLFVFWQIVALFPSTLGGDMAIATFGLLVNLAGNKHICGSPVLGPCPATLNPGLRRVTQAVSDWVLPLASPYYIPSSPLLASCPAVLGFWQALGWLVACLVVLGSEVVRRRAFLRTAVARARLGPSAAESASRWPFGSQAKVASLVRVVFMLLIAHSLMWALALDYS